METAMGQGTARRTANGYRLLMGLWSLLFAKVQYQILILGLDDAGKTTFLEQMKHIYAGSSPPEELKIPPTVGLNSQEHNDTIWRIGKLDVNRVRFVFWDLGGQASLRVLWDKYYSDSHAILYILDSTDANRMEESRMEIEKVLRDKDLVGAPLVVLANKQDLKHAMQAETIAKLLQLPANAMTAAVPASAPPSLLSSSSSSSSQPATPASTPASTPLTPASSLAAAAAAAASSITPLSPYTDHLIRLLPISALTGHGISRVIDTLLDILPKQRRTQELKARE